MPVATAPGTRQFRGDRAPPTVWPARRTWHHSS